jgi:hypothetical protein
MVSIDLIDVYKIRPFTYLFFYISISQLGYLLIKIVVKMNIVPHLLM